MYLMTRISSYVHKLPREGRSVTALCVGVIMTVSNGKSKGVLVMTMWVKRL